MLINTTIFKSNTSIEKITKTSFNTLYAGKFKGQKDTKINLNLNVIDMQCEGEDYDEKYDYNNYRNWNIN